jgi:hypothetical protein
MSDGGLPFHGYGLPLRAVGHGRTDRRSSFFRVCL